MLDQGLGIVRDVARLGKRPVAQLPHRGGLSQERREQLDDIAPAWCPAWPIDWQRCLHLTRQRLDTGGTLPTVPGVAARQGKDIGPWVRAQQLGFDKLSCRIRCWWPTSGGCRHGAASWMPEVMAAFGSPRPAVEAVRELGDPIAIWPAVFHALWTSALCARLDELLHERVLVSTLPQEAEEA
ncbi:hypothetical protein [Streptomyces collinus]|uniref:hypothetical protein n=1 Tax=Streptomyces collinus TaxID=42684 RepID=UPI0036C76BB2